MTPLARSGGCQAREMVCLVMSLAWMDVTGDGAGDTREEVRQSSDSKLPLISQLGQSSSIFNKKKKKKYKIHSDWVTQQQSRTIKWPKAKVRRVLCADGRHQ